MTTFAMPRPNPFVAAALALVGAARGSVEVDDQSVTVRLGAGFRATLARSSITGAALDASREISIGAHGWRGRWLVNTTTTNIVRLTVDPAGRGRVLGVPVDVRELRVSVEDPAGFLAAVGHSPSA